MNDKSIPAILKDKSRFYAAVREAARHILSQPTHIDMPITLYGGCLENEHPINAHVRVNFFRAMYRAGAGQWTEQLAGHPFEHALMEDEIARTVYLQHFALNLEGVKESCS